jgi:hypothetical protein
MSDLYTDSYADVYGESPGVGTPVYGDTYSDTYFDTYGQVGFGGVDTPTPGGGTVPGVIGGFPVPAPAQWRLFLHRPRSAEPYADVAATSRTVVLNLGEPSTCAFGLSGRDPNVDQVEEFIADVVWRRNGVAMLRCRVGASDDSIDVDTHRVNFSGVDYRSLLDRRYLSTTISTTGSPTGREQNEIVWDMVAQTQAQPNGNLGITKSQTWVSSGVSRKDVWEAGTAIGQAITDIGQRRSVDGLYGFDWDVMPDLQLRLFAPVRGTATGWSLEYGVNVSSVTRRLSSSDYSNRVVTQWRDRAGIERMAIAQSVDLPTRPEGLWESWQGGSWATTGEGLAQAQGMLAKSQGILPSYEVELMPGTWDPQFCWLGDTIPLTVQSGRLEVRGVPYRVQSIKIDIDDDGKESVSVTLGNPVFKLSTQLWLYGRSISTLERR